MKKLKKKLTACFSAFLLLFIAPVIAQTVASVNEEEFFTDRSLTVIDSLQTQEPPGAPPGEKMIATYYSKRFHMVERRQVAKDIIAMPSLVPINPSPFKPF